MSSPDPLNALRDAIKQNKSITLLDEAFQPCQSLSQSTWVSVPPDTRISKLAPTRLLKPSATSRDIAAHPEDFYPLQSVYIVWVTRDAGPAEYLTKAREAVNFVSVTERKPLVDWLQGNLEHFDRIIPLDGGSTTPTGSPSRTTTALPSTSTSSRPANDYQIGAKRNYIPDQKDILAVKKIRLGEVELRDRITVLRGSTKVNDFSSIKIEIQNRVNNAKETSKQAQAAPKPDIKPQPKKNRNAAPIIMISSSPTALITMYNVRKFLEDSQYESPEDAKRRMASEGNHKLDDVLPIYRKKNVIVPGRNESGVEKNIKYFVVDGVEALGKFGTDAWDRVICVMTTGQAWQFKPYKWQDPATLFHHVKGVHVCWSNDPPNPKVKDWNVADLKIDPNRRHVDKSIVANFWMQIDDWVLANKPWLSV